MSTIEAEPGRFSKKQIMSSALFSTQEKDVLDIVLQDGNGYTLDEAKEDIKLFLTKEVI
ncbi:hypothetical protein [Paenibacillus typhae]|uniref:hypothetical protein n=1 Tax=Paenibacillus typhae TaxID=1174501 RepID=UPI001C8D5FF6|nr:hypothetical protein [Paenibacillus typhae]MBY0014056.1 hypothetical protein [Paenibacillus typhae]